MVGVKLESVQCVRDLGVTIASNLKFFLHCKEASCKADRMLGFVKDFFFSFSDKKCNSSYVYHLSLTT